MNMGELIKETRIKAGKSQKELAGMVGLPPNAISKIESGLRGVKPEEIKRFSESLGVSAEYLLTGNIDENIKLIDLIVEKTKADKLKWYSLEDKINEKYDEKMGGNFFKRLRIIEEESGLNMFKWADVIDKLQYIQKIQVESPVYCKINNQVYILYGFGSESVLVGGNVDLKNDCADVVVFDGWLYNLSPIREVASGQISNEHSTVRKLASELSNL